MLEKLLLSSRVNIVCVWFAQFIHVGRGPLCIPEACIHVIAYLGFIHSIRSTA